LFSQQLPATPAAGRAYEEITPPATTPLERSNEPLYQPFDNDFFSSPAMNLDLSAFDLPMDVTSYFSSPSWEQGNMGIEPGNHPASLTHTMPPVIVESHNLVSPWMLPEVHETLKKNIPGHSGNAAPVTPFPSTGSNEL
jgi:hypothetical protein